MLKGQAKKDYQKEYMRGYMRDRRLKMQDVKTLEMPDVKTLMRKMNTDILLHGESRVGITIDADGNPVYEGGL